MDVRRVTRILRNATVWLENRALRLLPSLLHACPCAHTGRFSAAPTPHDDQYDMTWSMATMAASDEGRGETSPNGTLVQAYPRLPSHRPVTAIQLSEDLLRVYSEIA